MNAHILLVEDHMKTRLALAYWLEHTGYQVTQAPDGETAVELMEQHAFDVVLTDIVMGQVDGIEVLHTARQCPNRPSVILLTGHASVETAVAALRTGAYDYLLKPCDEEELLACVEGAIRRYAAERHLQEATSILSGQPSGDLPARAYHFPAAPPFPSHPFVEQPDLHIGEITIGPSRMHVTYQGVPVRLTPIEFTFLLYLAQRCGKVQPYREIALQTHRLDVENAEAQGLLRTHFLNLRKKFDPSYFVTDRGKGYMMTVPHHLAAE